MTSNCPKNNFWKETFTLRLKTDGVFFLFYKLQFPLGFPFALPSALASANSGQKGIRPCVLLQNADPSPDSLAACNTSCPLKTGAWLGKYINKSMVTVLLQSLILLNGYIRDSPPTRYSRLCSCDHVFVSAAAEVWCPHKITGTTYVAHKHIAVLQHICKPTSRIMQVREVGARQKNPEMWNWHQFVP